MKAQLKKFLLAATAAFALAMPAANAEVVTVNGTGASESAAIQDAKRNAVEKVVGTAIHAESATVDLQLLFDAINSRTQGYVTSCDVISRKVEGGAVNITAKVDVSAEPNSELMKDVDVVMTLNDPRLAVVVEHYGDDGGETYRRYAEMCAAAIREELNKRGFTHIIDTYRPADADYVIVGHLTVDKGRAITLPVFADMSKPQMGQAETGLTKLEAIMDCKIKRSDTDEIIGEFHANGENVTATAGGLDNKAVQQLAANAAQNVRALFSRQASKVFTSVKVIAQGNDGGKVLQLEDILRQTQGVTSVYVRSFLGGKCTIDVGTALSPNELNKAIAVTAAGTLTVRMQSYTSTMLDLVIE